MITVTATNFEADIVQATKPVMLDVWVSWCAPCRMMEPVVSEIDAELSDQLITAKLNADAEPELTQKLGVMGLPSFVMMRNGQIIHSSTGAKPKAVLVAELGQYLGVKVAR